MTSNCQRSKSTGRDSNPRHRITGAVSLPLDDQCLQSGKLKAESGRSTSISAFRFRKVGPVGLEPTPTRLRAGNAAANTLVPSTSRHRSRRGGSRTLDLRLIRTPLSQLSYAPVRVGPEGIEPTPCGLKVRCAASYTTTPSAVGPMRFNRRTYNIFQLLSFFLQW